MVKSAMGRKDEKPTAIKQSSVFAGYKGGEEMPLAGYAGLLGAFNVGLVGTLIAAENVKRSKKDRVSLSDLLLLGIAAYKLSRIIASDRVTAPLRAPFVEYEKPAGTSEVKEHSRGTGAQRAMGDLGFHHHQLGRKRER